MSDSQYLAWGFPSEPGESKYIPAKEGHYRPATQNEIASNLPHLSERDVAGIHALKLCYTHEDGESFLIDTMEDLENFIIDKMD